jgi:ribose transport system substrate-binding protein
MEDGTAPPVGRARKLLSLALALGVVVGAFALAGCGGSSGSSGGGGKGGTSASGGKKVTVGIVLPIVGWWFYGDMLRGAQAMKGQLAKDNVNLLIGSSPGATESGVTQYFPSIDEMVVRRPDAIIGLNAGPPTVAPLLRAQQQGIKVVIADGNLPGLSPASAVGTPNRDASKAGVTEFLKQVPANAKIGYLVVPGPGPVADRINGANDAIAGTGVKVISQEVGGCDQTKSADDVVAMVRAHPDIDAIYAPCGGGALGAARGKQLLGAAGKHVKIWGFDGSPPEINYVKQGLLAGDIAQRPFDEAQMAIRTAIDAARGKPVPSLVDVPYKVVTSANVSQS